MYMLLASRKKPVAIKYFLKHTKFYAYLAEEIPQLWRWFSQGEAHPLHSGCADNSQNFPKCEKLECTICGSGGLCSCSPLNEKKKKKMPHKIIITVLRFTLTMNIDSENVSKLAVSLRIAF